MKEPNRWRDPNGGADAETRALLQNPPPLSPSRGEADEIWAGLSAHLDVTFTAPGPDGSQLGPSHGPVHGPQVGPVAAAAGTGALAAKVTLAVVLLATVGGVVGTRVISSRDRHARPTASGTARAEARPALSLAPSPIVVAPPTQPPAPTIPKDTTQPEMRPRPAKVALSRSAFSTTAPTMPAVAFRPPIVEDRPLRTTVPTLPTVAFRPPIVEDRPVPPPTPAPTSTSPMVPQATGQVASAPTSVNELLEEGRRLDRVRFALRAHDPDLALQLLGERSVRTNDLAQERDALTIEAEAAKPALRAKASERATVFLRSYPNSPYRARIAGIISGSE